MRVARKNWLRCRIMERRCERRRRAWITFRGLEFVIFVICFLCDVWVSAPSERRIEKGNEKRMRPTWAHLSHVPRHLRLLYMIFRFCLFFFLDYVLFSAPDLHNFAMFSPRVCVRATKNVSPHSAIRFECVIVSSHFFFTLSHHASQFVN